MAGFQFNGEYKPVGWLSSTRIGRDWSTMHVNDIRRLVGGDVFKESVFGSAASVDGTDRQWTEVAQSLMRKVFNHAQDRDMDLLFALDVDTESASPQSLILRLPESARFATDVEPISWMGQSGGGVLAGQPRYSRRLCLL